MARRLILDTGVLIAAERGLSRAVAEAVERDDDVVIAAVTVAQLRTGIEWQVHVTVLRARSSS